ncbi:MAG: hypothetical protein SCH71_00755 [Desulfobulbaceae bacterium]|nr:hypothetical protein [Desulfobulbaceae bacterium]
MDFRYFKGIIDSTLREGVQTPGIDFGFAEKFDIIHQLVMLGIDEIELGVASSMYPELPFLVREAKWIVRGKSRLSLWCRCRTEDIEFAAQCAPDVLSLSIPVSDLHLMQKLGRDRQWILQTLVRAVTDARKMGFHSISIGLEDATRADQDFLAVVIARAESAGASRIRLADTVGIATPAMISNLVLHARQHSSLPLGIHAHNDFGMATANTVAALEAGAGWADATILGLGERAGNCRLEELVGYLGLVRGENRYQPEKLTYLCNLVAAAAGFQISRHHPVVGEEIFTAETGLHVQGLTANPKTYEPYDPCLVGRRRTLQFGKKTGKRAVRDSLASMGMEISEAESAKLVSQVRQVAGKKKRALDIRELFNLAMKKGAQLPPILPGSAADMKN